MLRPTQRSRAQRGQGQHPPDRRLTIQHGWNIALYQFDASGGDLLIARDAGGWASTAVLDEIYAHVDVHDAAFDAALRKVWSESR